jgi:hypothetical protein
VAAAGRCDDRDPARDDELAIELALNDGASATYAVGVGLLAMLISSPIVWPSYFVFLLPSMIYLLGRLR